MRESEMRQRIEGFLKRRMQGMLAPALGVGLAVAGCGKTTSTPIDSAPNLDGHAGPIEDAAGLTHDTPVYSAPIAPDGSTADAFATQETPPMGPDTTLDLAPVADANVPMDLPKPVDLTKIDELQVPDGKKDTLGEVGTGVDAGVDSGGVRYGSPYFDAAPLRDAGPDLGSAPVYIAQLPLGGEPAA